MSHVGYILTRRLITKQADDDAHSQGEITNVRPMRCGGRSFDKITCTCFSKLHGNSDWHRNLKPLGPQTMLMLCRIMQPLNIQRLIALPYLVLGAWCLFAPQMVERLMINPAYQHLSATSALFIGCFGAQAVLGGLLIVFSRWTAKTFLIYAFALLPFFGFNYWFVYEVPILNRWMALDFGANAVMLALSVWGWRILRRGER